MPALYSFSHGSTFDTYGRCTNVSTGFLTGSPSGSKYFGPATTLTDSATITQPWEKTFSNRLHLGTNLTTANDTRVKIIDQANSTLAGPHVGYYNSNDANPTYPCREDGNFSHNNNYLMFDGYYDAGAFRTSVGTGGSVAQIYKVSNTLQFNFGNVTNLFNAGDAFSITGSPQNAMTINSNASTFIRKLVSDASITYSTGTASQTAQTVTGSGTAWTNSMVGGVIVYTDGNSGLILSVTSSTVMTVNVNQAIFTQTYIIYYGGMQASRGSLAQVNNYTTGSQIYVGTNGKYTITPIAPTDDRTYYGGNKWYFIYCN